MGDALSLQRDPDVVAALADLNRHTTFCIFLGKRLQNTLAGVAR